jgi:aspergillopepsin I
MHFSASFIITASALLTAVAAAPTSAQTKQFTSTQVSNKGFVQKKTPFQALAHAAYRYTGSVPDHIQETLVNNGEVAAIPSVNDREYLSPVTIGGQTLHLDFDTGSSDLWVFGPDIPSEQVKGRAIYDPAKSKTFHNLTKESWQIMYADLSNAGGYVGTDIVEIGGTKVTTAAVEVATVVSDSFANQADIGGLLGLGFPNINNVSPDPQVPFFFKAIETLAEPVFTTTLKHAAPGTYDFGHIDPAKYVAPLHYVEVNNTEGYWKFSSAGYKIGNKTYTNKKWSIADSGTSIMYLDDQAVNDYYAQVKGAVEDDDQGGFVFPCDAVLPDLGVELGNGYYGTVPGTLMNYRPIEDKSGHCYGGIQSNGIVGDLQIYGDVLFKTQFIVFDGKNNRLGFAPQK